MDVSARSYIATENFVGDFLKYVVTKVEYNTVGSLSQVTLDSTQCPAGRVLRENGRKLVPKINPGVATYMVGVYDNQTGLSGFIDPNSPVFAVYNNSRPNFLVDNVDPGDGASGGSSNLTDRSAPVLTNGLVSAATTVSAGLTVTAGTSISAGTTVTAQKYKSAASSGTGTSIAPLTTSCGTATFNGDLSPSQIIYSTQITAQSLVFITVNNVGPRATSVVPSDGSFIVYSNSPNDASVFYWFIVN
jgi:hypothetical protein